MSLLGFGCRGALRKKDPHGTRSLPSDLLRRAPTFCERLSGDIEVARSDGPHRHTRLGRVQAVKLLRSNASAFLPPPVNSCRIRNWWFARLSGNSGLFGTTFETLGWTAPQTIHVTNEHSHSSFTVRKDTEDGMESQPKAEDRPLRSTPFDRQTHCLRTSTSDIEHRFLYGGCRHSLDLLHDKLGRHPHRRLSSPDETVAAACRPPAGHAGLADPGRQLQHAGRTTKPSRGIESVTVYHIL